MKKQGESIVAKFHKADDSEEIKKEGLELWKQPKKGTMEWYKKALLHFREIMCSKEYTLEQKDKAFYDFCQDAFNCAKEAGDIPLFHATVIEWEKRRYYEVWKLFNEGKISSPDPTILSGLKEAL